VKQIILASRMMQYMISIYALHPNQRLTRLELSSRIPMRGSIIHDENLIINHQKTIIF